MLTVYSGPDCMAKGAPFGGEVGDRELRGARCRSPSRGARLG